MISFLTIAQIICICINPLLSSSHRKWLAASVSDFELVQDAKTWLNAKSHCETAFGTGLATIISDDQLREAISIANANSISESLWIGLNDIDNEDNWVWSSGIDCNYALNGNCKNDYHWDDGQPNNSNNDCAELTISTQMFNDAPCSYTRPFLCQSYVLLELLW